MSRLARAAPIMRHIGAALGVGAFVLVATAGGFRVGLLLLIAVSARSIRAHARSAGAQPARHARRRGDAIRTACPASVPVARLRTAQSMFFAIFALQYLSRPDIEGHPMDPLTVMTAVTAGLKLLQQFRETALSWKGKDGGKETRIQTTHAGSKDSELEIRREGEAPRIVRAYELRTESWDYDRYKTLVSVVSTLFSQFNALERERTLASGLERIKMDQQMERIKDELCPRFREMIDLSEKVLGISLHEDFSLKTICGNWPGSKV